jgi:hypothetical protein
MFLLIASLISPVHAQDSWSDDFNDNDVSDWINLDASYSVSGGRLIHSSNGHTGPDMIVDPGMPSGTLEYTVTLVGSADHGMGLTLSYASSSDNCGLFLHGGTTLYKWNPSTIETAIASPSYSTGSSVSHTFVAEVSYNNVDVSLDGVLLYSGDIGCNSFTGNGYLGIGAHSGVTQYTDELTVEWPHDDADGDGYTEDDGDCDDNDSTVNPGATEYCDGVDNDCDNDTDEDDAADVLTWYADSDSDGYGDAAVTDIDCYQPTGYVADDTDCDDTDGSINPSATEYCDGVDNDCDNATDEDDAADALTWYADSDSDGYGDAASNDIDCYQPTGYVADDTDCDDSEATTYPGATEYCDGVDNDCDTDIDEDDAVDVLTWYADTDSDGYGDAASTDIDCYAPTGYVADATDCDDGESTTYPGADEYCDGVDNDCDTDIDEDDAVDALTWYADTDGDGEGDAAVSDIECYQPTGYVENSTDCDDTTIVLNTADSDADGFTSCDSDCNDTDATINVDATEIWYDGVDQNCDGASDYDQDGDSYDHMDYGGTDCDDENADINTDATEIWYDGTDQDCDTLSDYDADYDGQDSETYGGEDCDDADPDTYTGAPDTPYDGIITDCANANDYDADGDGVLSMDHGGKDCDDANSDINPNAEEIWYDGVDQDCDGNDDDQDGDGYPVDDDCDDTDPDRAEDCSADTGEPTSGADTGLTANPDKESGCFSSTTGGKPMGPAALLMAGLLFVRRSKKYGAHAGKNER